MKALLLKIARLLLGWGEAIQRWYGVVEEQPKVRQTAYVSANEDREKLVERLKNLATIYVDDDGFAANFARNARHFIVRITGGCGLMEPKHAVGMDNLTKALGGEKAGDPFFDGFGLFGASRMHKLSDPSVIVPGVTEVLAAIHRKVKRAAILGIVAMTEDLRYGTADTGILLEVNPKNDFYTIVHPDAKSLQFVKPDHQPLPEYVMRTLASVAGTDQIEPPFDPNKALWRAEYRKCLKHCSDLMKLEDWRALLIVYNGGSITEEELLIWSTLGKADPRWQVLIVKDSGRIADKYANDKDWLKEHPSVHVAENNVVSIRSKLLKLGAIRHPRTSS